MLGGFASALKWLFFRLPWPFSVTFALVSVGWFLFGFDYVYEHTINPIAAHLQHPNPNAHSWPSDFVQHTLSLGLAVIGLLSFVVGFLVAHNFSAFVNRLAFKLPARPLRYPFGFLPIAPHARNPRDPFSRSTRIGIVLSGGGAKGAFQAGAMKAIYEFLESHNALGNVKVIAGTSIGSWNAMFWLAGMIKSSKGWSVPGCLEWWWGRLTARHLVAPRYFLPTFNNCFLSTEPWQREFDQIFGSAEVKKFLFDTDIHFYLTRSNVRSAALECATNNETPSERNKVKYHYIKGGTPDEFFANLKTAVFASMDLPPIFPYMAFDDELYEDGGVIENLPIRFAATENCDLIFVLPLNSDFEEEPNRRSLAARISRVLDVQQGALERHGFKLLNLYNEIAALRNRIKQLSPHETEQHPPLKRAMLRTHQEAKIFAVCPDKSFVHSTINTRDLWNTKGARVAFHVMYQATRGLLADFDFDSLHKKPEIHMIRRSGEHFLDRSVGADGLDEPRHAAGRHPAKSRRHASAASPAAPAE